MLLPRAALKVLDAAEEYRKGVEYFNRVVEVVEKMDNYDPGPVPAGFLGS